MAAQDFDTPYRGGFIGNEHRFALAVYFEDTDTAGVVYYANYLKFMERARSDMIRAVGIDQAAMLKGTAAPISSPMWTSAIVARRGLARSFKSSARLNWSAHHP